jgi:two-component system, cell cycle sensor histidine kinase and response regulator CckA
VRELLESAGYTVLDAATPDEAVAIAKSHTGPIHLLLTDIIMPRMSGPELARQIASLKPKTRVVFMSGYSDEVFGEAGVLKAETPFVQKPFSADVLRRTIRRALG